MASKSGERYLLAPQMRYYDRLGVKAVPYLGFFHTPLYKSSAVNTDILGFRMPEQAVDLARGDEEIYLFGGSAAFGVGATSESKTLSAHMGNKSGIACKNAGGRAFISTQELLLGLYALNLSKAKKIYIFSGINDLVIYHMSRFWSPFGSQFFWQRTRSAFGASGPFRNLVVSMLKLLFREKLNIENFSLRDYIFYRTGKMELDHIRGLQLNSGLGKDLLCTKEKDPGLFSVLGKNLDLWLQTASNYGSEIVYCLQPYLPWTSKPTCEEEKELLRITENISGKSWRAAQNKMDDSGTYDWYRRRLRKECETRGIKFLDANRIFSGRSDWCFVDKVHLTDNGYQLCAEFLLE